MQLGVYTQLTTTLQVAEFTSVLQHLPTNSLLAAAFITYLGREPEDVRQVSLGQWCSDLRLPAPWSLIKFLASETELLTWKTEGTHSMHGNPFSMPSCPP